MSETIDHPTPPTPTADRRAPSRLNQVLAWVGIVAGVVFVVAVVFFSGFFLGKHSGGSHGMWGHHVKGVHMIHRGQHPMGPWGPGPGPGGQAPGGPPMGPGGPGGGSPSPSTPPTPHP